MIIPAKERSKLTSRRDEHFDKDNNFNQRKKQINNS